MQNEENNFQAPCLGAYVKAIPSYKYLDKELFYTLFQQLSVGHQGITYLGKR